MVNKIFSPNCPRLYPDLIFDVGANNGNDTAFYLAKGFRVVAVEADPKHVTALQERFSLEIANHRLIVVPLGIAEQRTTMRFYRNPRNTHWSSFFEDWAKRDGEPCEELEIDCIPLSDLIYQHGVPYYLKIDIEGSDLAALKSLHGLRILPHYISIEERGDESLTCLYDLGYVRFKLVDQSKHHLIRLPSKPLEGQYVNWRFDDESSGPFGEETPGTWMSYEDTLKLYRETLRTPDGTWIGPNGSWWDIHATR